MSPDSSTPRGAVALEVSNGMVRLIAETTGRGPTKARTIFGRDEVMVSLRDTLTKGEANLVAGGYGDQVLEVRRNYQRVMQPKAVELVEGLLGRRVIGFMSDNHLDPDLAVEVFILDPISGNGAGAVEADDTVE